MVITGFEPNFKTAFLGLMMMGLLCMGAQAFASASGVTYQGRILKPDGSPLSGTNTQFKLQLRSPAPSSCLMYEELQSQDLRNSSGMFSLTLNDGSGSRTDSTGLTLDKIFANHGTFNLDVTTCSAGTGNYTPSSDDGRSLVVLFKDETMTTWEPIPAQKINFVPFAFEAKQVAGFTPQSLVRVAEADGTLDFVSPLSNAQYNELLALVNGTTTQYSKSSQLGGVALPTMNSGDVLGWNGTNWVSTSAVGGANSVSSSMLQAASVTTNAIANNVSISTSGTLASAITTTRDFKIFAASPSAYAIDMQAPALTASYSLVWPMSAGSANQVLTTDGSGHLSWVAPTASPWTTTGSNISYNAGNVGIGTTSPYGQLEVAGGSSTGILQISSSSTGYGPQLRLNSTGANGHNWIMVSDQTLNSGGAGSLEFYDGTASAVRLMVNSSGSIGVGTTSPTALLHEVNAGVSSGAVTMTAASGASTVTASGALTLNAGDYLVPTTTTSQARTVVAGGTGTSFTVTPAFSAAVSGETFTIYHPSLNSDGTMAIQGLSGRTTVGSAAPPAKIYSSDNTPNNPMLYVNGKVLANDQVHVQSQTTWPQFESWGFGYSTGFVGFYSGGTIASPTYPNDGDWISEFSGRNGIRRTNSASMVISAAGAHSVTANGAQIDFWTTPAGTTTLSKRMTIADSGNVGIGTTSPTALLNLKAGTATAGTAPLKFTQGTLLGTVEDGAMEYASTGLWFTIGSTRYVIPLNSASGNYSNVATIGNASGSITMTPMSGNSVVVNSTTVSNDSSSGALIVSGGVGVSGAVNASGNISAGGSVTAITNIVTPQLYGSTAASGTIKIDGTSNAAKGNVLLASAGGNVGIGTTSPAVPLEVVASSNENLRLTYDATHYSRFAQTGAGGIDLAIVNYGGGSTYLGSYSGTSSTRISSSGALFVNSSANSSFAGTGNVGIGTTAPAGTLDVEGGTAASGTNGAPIFLIAQNGSTSGATNGGNIFMNPGAKNSTGTPGSVYIGTTTPVTWLPQGSLYVSGNIFSNGGAGFIAQSGGGYTFGTSSAGVSGWSVSSSADWLKFTTNSGEQMRINGSGNVGIGTTAPSVKLDVKGSTIFRGPTVGGLDGELYYDTGSHTYQYYNSGSSAWQALGTGSINYSGTLWSQNGSNVYYNSGNVGIGTSTPSSKLQISQSLAPIVNMTETSTGANLALMENSGQFWISSQSPSGAGALVDINPSPVDGTSNAMVRLFRSTSTTGARLLQIMRGDNSTTVDAQIAAGTGSTGSTFFAAGGGNVGIGTTAPGYKLDVAGSVNTSSNYYTTVSGGFAGIVANSYSNTAFQGSRIGYFRAEGTSSSPTAVSPGDYIGWGDYYGYDGTSSVRAAQVITAVDNVVSTNIIPTKFEVQTLDTSGNLRTRFRLGSNDSAVMGLNGGNVGIGTTAPTTKLQVAGEISPSSTNTYSLGDASLLYTAVYATNGTIQTSDARSKKEITNSDLGLAFINALRPVSYRWKDGPDADLHYGLIAQETEKAVNESIIKAGYKPKPGEQVIISHDAKTDKYGLKYTELISPLIKAVQEVFARLTDLDARTAQLETENRRLRDENEAIKVRLDALERHLQPPSRAKADSRH